GGQAVVLTGAHGEAVLAHGGRQRRLARLTALADDLDDGDAVCLGEGEVALVVGGDGHDGARAVAGEDVVGDPHGDARAVDGVERVGAGEGAGLVTARLPVAVALAARLGDV